MKKLILNTGIIFMMGIILWPGTEAAQESLRKAPAASELDAILEGFDEHPGTPQEDRGLDDVLKGFEEGEGTKEEVGKKEKVKKPPYWELSGSLGLGISYSFAHDAPEPGEADYRGFSRVRPDLHLNLDVAISDDWKALVSGRAFYDFAYQIKGRDEYTDEVLDTYEKEAEFGEVYVHGSLLPNLDLKVGRQIIVWGKSDNIRVVDVLNPLDNREPGLVDIEDLRLPVAMSKLDYYFSKWNLSAIAVHEIRFNKNPVLGSEFYPFDTTLPEEEKPANSLENTEYGLALNGIFRGWDLSFYGARFFDDQSHLEMLSPGHLERRHSRLSMVGVATNVALGNWLLKSEAALFNGLEFFAIPGETNSRVDILAGVEYSGFTNTTLSLEAVNRHIIDFDSRLEAPPDSAQENEFQTVLRYSGDFLHDTLHVVLLGSTFGVAGEDGAFQRFSVEYDLTDFFSLIVGVVTYQSGDKALFEHIGDNDRLFLEATYSF